MSVRRTKRVGFATSVEHPSITSDDALLVAALADAGLQAVPLVWNPQRPTAETAEGPTAPSGVDAIVLRSCWDANRHPVAFERWLGVLRTAAVPVFNPPELCLWNLHKAYLLELQGKGALIPETVLVPRGGDIGGALGALSGERLVVKPAVSLNGEDTWLVSRQEEVPTAVSALSANRDVLVQEFVPEIVSGGELSFVFFRPDPGGGGELGFSHAIRKLPASGEFRVQVEHGGRRAAFSPSKKQIDEAAALLSCAPPSWLYARVDVVVQRGRMVLMELELIDPMLFFAFDDAAPRRFVQALERAL